MSSKRRYGWRRSPEDARDKIADTTGLTVLDSVDLRSGPMPRVFDQGQLGSCTANAVAACLQYDCSLDRQPTGGPCHRRSRLDIYYGERALEGELGQGDTGAYGRDGFKFAQQTGVLFETYGRHPWPYDISTFEGPPPTGGTRRKLTKPYALVPQTQNAIMAALSNQQLVAFGFTVYESFESTAVATSGIIPLPLSQEAALGGHEMVVVGYNAAYPKYAIVRNSWGSGWGAGGYCMFPWAYLLDASLASDHRTIVRATT